MYEFSKVNIKNFLQIVSFNKSGLQKLMKLFRPINFL